MDYKIITLDDQTFIDACMKLREKVTESGFTPDTIIAIPRGGSFMQDAAWNDYKSTPVRLIGKSGRNSLKAITSFILKSLPATLRDKIRIWDAKHLVKRKNHIDSNLIELPLLSNRIVSALVIDDAVDSGATLLAVTEQLKKAYPHATIRAAALTVTSVAPLIMPDYYLYHDCTLIRMPWSADAR